MTVYLIRNLVNGRCYVGKTTQSVGRRWAQHCAEARLNRLDTPLYRDMRAMGVGCFELKVLGEADSQRRLAQLERRFIREFKAVAEGYNLTEASQGGRMKFRRTTTARPHTPVHRKRIAEGMRSYWAEKKEAARESQEAA